MVHVCYVCKTKQTKENQLTVRRFPSNPVLRVYWLSAFGMEEIDIMKYTGICNRHFTQDCFHETISGKIGLKRGSIPSLYLKLKRKLEFSDSDSESPVDTETALVPKTETVHLEKLRLTKEKSSTLAEAKSFASNDCASTLPSTSISVSEIVDSPPNCKKTSDINFNCPETAKRHYDNVSRKLSAMKTLYKQARRQNILMKRKINSLISLVNHLQSKKLLTQDGKSALLQPISSRSI